ncbi:MAG: hypothetical protein O6943_06080, partial [Bacteroidetes bacterium]|nr:hypothetical protein [Bacteroidota bacterium]
VWQEDKVYLKANDPSVAGSQDELLADAVIFGATPRAVDKVIIAGETVVKDGVHVCYEEACRGYRESLVSDKLFSAHFWQNLKSQISNPK